MSFWLEDADFNYLGDFGSVSGTTRLAKRKDALGDFVRAGTADEELIQKVIDVCKGDSEVGYIADMLDGATAPVIISDGE